MKQISFLINVSVNTLDHVKLLLKSLKENLKGQEHEILVFVDSDNEGSLEYLRTQKDNFFDLKIITLVFPPLTLIIFLFISPRTASVSLFLFS